jgi:ATP-dependent helicase/nuclease subunit A
MQLDLSGPKVRLDAADPALRLTEAQRAAMATDREILVSAGAGAGKTHTLALRYVALLLEIAEDAVSRDGVPRPDIESVLVLTFTEKAAEEMSERCYQRLLGLSSALRRAQDELTARHGDLRARRLIAAVDHLVDTFNLARISTFHAFCGRLLREFPAETRSDPGFEVLEPSQAERLRADAAERALAELAKTQSTDFPLLLDAFGSRRTVLAALDAALSERGALAERLTEHAAGLVTVDDLIRRAAVRPETVKRFLTTEALPTLERIATLLSWVTREGFWAHDELKPLVEALQRLPDDPLRLYELYQRSLALLLRDGKVKGFTTWYDIDKADAWPRKELFKAAKEELGALAATLGDWPERYRLARRLPVRADGTLLDVLRALGRLFLAAQEHLQEALLDRGSLDFSELQARAARAIAEKPALVEQLQRRFRYIMVDEFQDTDEVQWSIVRAIGRPGGGPSDRIFLVGDAKQAIYGFRGSDVTVFRGAEAELGVKALEFPENFRSAPELIDWFNDLFTQVLGPTGRPGPAYEARYSPLRAAGPERDGSVRIVLHGEKTGAQSARAEAEAAASLLAAEILPDRGVYKGLDALNRALHPTPPIAVLLRSRTHLLIWEEALRRRGVAFVVAGGVGFWSRAEVVDLVNALDALANNDRLSLVGLLRSPLMGLTDQDIQDLYAQVLLDRFATRELPPGLSERVYGAQSRLRRLAQLRYRVPAASLIEALVSGCAAWHLYQREDSSGQAEANVRRLISKVNALHERGGGGVEEIARLLVRQVEQAQRESEASLTPAAARVVLMTVHASKGLEFPVVIVPGLAERSPPNTDPLIARRLDGRWSLACKVHDPESTIQERVDPGLYGELSQRRHEEELAEHKRLLYVAVTRARRHLVLLGAPTTKESGPEPRTWMELLELHHGKPLLTGPRLTVLDSGELDAAAQAPATPSPRPALPGPDARRAVGVVPATIEVEISPSSLDLFMECPARWYRRHLLSVHEHVNRRQVRDEQLAAARGEVIHGLLEDDLAHDRAQARRRWEARAHAEGCAPAEVEELLARLYEHLERSAADPWLRRVLDAPGFAELPFRVPFHNLVLRGKIDRLWRDPNSGRWSVLDYKSEAVAGTLRDAAARHERQLLSYAWAASRILRSQGLPEVEGAQVYFTERAVPVELGPLGAEAQAEFEGLLDHISDVAAMSWSQVERLAVSTPRACRDCGFFKRGCRGYDPEAEEREDDEVSAT